MYESDKAMENGIKSVQNNAGTTKVEDLS